MISMFLIKTALLRWGIIIQDVKFDIDGECVIVNYRQGGEPHKKMVSFREIEELFVLDPEVPAAPVAGDRAPGYISGPGIAASRPPPGQT